jgi:DNA polymerase III delta prime subunit
MHFDGVDKIEKLASAIGFSIFELSSSQDQSLILPKAIHIAPQKDENSIKIEEIKKISELTSTKQTTDLYIVVEQAELLTLTAANSLLKQLEEPGNKLHYVFLTTNSNLILQTIKSRAFCYVHNKIAFDPENIDAKTRAKVRELIQAKPKDLKAIIDPLTKDKKTARIKAIEFTRCAAELCLDSYYKTGNKLFLEKAQKAANACQAITENGNIRIQFIANML